MPADTLSKIARYRLVGLLGAGALLCATPALADMTSQAKRTENKDGSTSMVFTNELADLGTKMGVNVTEPAADSVADPLAGQEGFAGSAFANVSVKAPDWLIWQKSTLNVTLTPSDETGKVSTTFSRSVPIVSGLKATVSDSYAFERTSDSESWETSKALSVSMESGTSLSVAAKAEEGQDRWLPSLSASQKMPGGIQLTTSVSDDGSTLNKSLTAGFTHRW